MLKGDLKISKRMALGLTCLISLFTMADYVSTRSGDGIIIEKEVMSVGSVVFRMDSKDPKEIYGGTWELITGDAILAFGNGSNLTGQIEGTNIKTVPLQEHTHTGSTTSNGAHSHTFSRPRGDKSWGNGGGNTWWGGNNYSHSTNTAGNHTHTLTIDETGVENATIDVSGAKIKMNVWQRIN